jgi:hypothetical protein
VKYVFLINNPVVLLIATLVIVHEKIPLNQVLVVQIRKTGCRLLSGAEILEPDEDVSRVFSKLLMLFRRYCPGICLKKKIEKKFNESFKLYAPWASPTVMELIKSKRCVGHYYLEEGEMAYSTSSGPYEKSGLIKKIRLWFSLYPKKYYLDEALGCYSISRESFPGFPPHKRTVLNAHHRIFDFYRPKYQKNETFFLIPAILPVGIDWHSIWKKLCSEVSGKIVVKFHPVYKSKQDLAGLIIDSIPKEFEYKFTLCHVDTILEAEMILNTMIVYGTATTSLRRYAEKFGSTYHVIF